jgi:hypothetical protein
LNFAIFLLSVAPSFVVSLLTTKIESDRVFYIFVVVAAVAAVLGAFFLVAWRRNRQSIASVVAAIRNRMPPLGEARDVHTIDVPS